MSSDPLKGPGNIEPTKPTQPVPAMDEGSAKPFDEYMQQGGPEGTDTTGTAKAEEGLSPMDIAKGPVQPTTHPTMDSVRSQMASTSSALGDLQEKLNTPNLKLKPSAKYLLRNKLTEANKKIRDAAAKTGVDVGPPAEGISRSNPAMRFLGLLSDGMKQLNAAQTNIAKISKGGSSIRPAELLMVQVKLTRAQQEIEYASTILSNAISSVKMLFNTQI